MIALVGKMSRPLAETVIVQEQLALALNRAGKGEQAEKVLLDLIDRRGSSSETYVSSAGFTKIGGKPQKRPAAPFSRGTCLIKQSLPTSRASKRTGEMPTPVLTRSH
jgi:hypothetical protein